MEQEIASIIKYVLDASENPTPYYYRVPQGFHVPAIYFPAPEVDTKGNTFHSYKINYVWYLKFLHRHTNAAYEVAIKALQAIKNNRNIIPLVDFEGNQLADGIRLKDTKLKEVEEGAMQLMLSWSSIQPYHAEVLQKAQEFVLNFFEKEQYQEAILSEETLKQVEVYLPKARERGES